MFPSGIGWGVFQRDDNIPVICGPVTINWDLRGHHKPSTDFTIYLVLLRRGRLQLWMPNSRHGVWVSMELEDERKRIVRLR